jgi:sec-independent protein translocase protein TatA
MFGGKFGAPELLLILVLVFLLFGAKRLPDAARGLGRSLRIFKSEVGAMSDDDKAASTGDSAAAPTSTPKAAPTTPESDGADRPADSGSNGSR